MTAVRNDYTWKDNNMEARNRMADVAKVRCNVCQDFLRLIIKDGWQQELYNKAKYEIENEGRSKDKYIPVYDRMRETGIDNFSIDDMDVTLISEIVHNLKGVAQTCVDVRKELEQIVRDRNIMNHSGENEEAEELYLRGLLSLCALKNFIKVIDKKCIDVDDKRRSEFVYQCSKRIEELKSVLDEERAELIQREKEIQKVVQRISEASDEEQSRLWVDYSGHYFDKAFKFEHNPDVFYDFVVKCSDAGIKNAHSQASINYFYDENYDEWERRIQLMFLDYGNSVPYYQVKDIANNINNYIMTNKCERAEQFARIIHLIDKNGFGISKEADGLYRIMNIHHDGNQEE